MDSDNNEGSTSDPMILINKRFDNIEKKLDKIYKKLKKNGLQNGVENDEKLSFAEIFPIENEEALISIEEKLAASDNMAKQMVNTKY